MAEDPAEHEQDIVSDAAFGMWWESNRDDGAPIIMFLYRNQKSGAKRQTSERDVEQISADCADRNPPIEFVAIDTREVADVFTSLGIQGGTPKLAFVRYRGRADGSGQRLEVVGTTLLTPKLQSFKTWIKDCLTQQ